MAAYLLAALSMALRDGLGTLLVVAEAKGRSWLAGGLDAAGDLATVLVTIYGAGTVLDHGWTLHSILVLLVMCVTSFIGTTFWTRVGARMGARSET